MSASSSCLSVREGGLFSIELDNNAEPPFMVTGVWREEEEKKNQTLSVTILGIFSPLSSFYFSFPFILAIFYPWIYYVPFANLQFSASDAIERGFSGYTPPTFPRVF